MTYNCSGDCHAQEAPTNAFIRLRWAQSKAQPMSASPLLAAQNWDGSRKNPILSRTINLQNLRRDSTTLAPQVPSSVSPKHLTIPASSE